MFKCKWTYIEAAVQYCMCVIVLGPHHVSLDVVQPDALVPRGHQQELGGVWTKLDRRDAIVGTLVQLEFIGYLRHNECLPCKLLSVDWQLLMTKTNILTLTLTVPNPPIWIRFCTHPRGLGLIYGYIRIIANYNWVWLEKCNNPDK